jgi:glycosyltransferase involved in cell wall biosynthesis
MHVTAIICTWNRARSLARTLDSFARLEIPQDVTWELLVVNNKCNDETDRVIAQHADRLPIRRLFEARAGKSHAANAAVRNATGELLLWTDDDVVVDASWLAAYVAAARAWPGASYFGGTVDPLFEGHVPAWITRNLDLLYEPYALAQHGLETFPVGSRHVVGASMAIRADVAKRYSFNPQLGPTGEKALRGEETELIGRLRADGLSGVWVGAARVQHMIGQERLSTSYLWHWYGGLGAYTAEQHGVAPVALVMGAPRWALRQYAALCVKYACLSALKNPAWLRTLRQAALMRGYIQEARRRAAARATPRVL